jgi:hypothetical protein
MTRVICADRRSVVVLHALVCRRPESGRWSVRALSGVLYKEHRLSSGRIFSTLNVWRRAGLLFYDHSIQVWGYDDEAVFAFAKVNRRDLEYGDLCKEIFERLRPDDKDLLKEFQNYLNRGGRE